MGMARDVADALLKRHVQDERMLNHSYASEAVMRALARRLGQNEERWGLAGLLHDLDIELVRGDLSVHGLEAARILTAEGIDPEVVDAVKMHNEMVAGTKRSTVFHHALAAGETITGLISATAMVYPDKKLSSVKVKSITKRMKEKAFAASVRRDNILECEKIGIPLDEFAGIALEAMKDIHEQLGL
jgi:putative nucleotidyltransferase with HDIG domain